MNQRKGITPIIATVVLLLIAVAIAGAAYTYITGYWGGLTQKTLESPSASCSTSGVTLNLRNSGTGNITITDGGGDVTVTKLVIAGNASSAKSLTYSSTVLVPNQGGSMTDAFCNSSTLPDRPTCKYTILAGGRPIEQQVSC
ncbi:MAG TPA: archaellin/type IV pilin N-terminal domain-containing protein [archaeon]|nr:archaellin/type IV pilin N-terminal domain-containing protein [archaeon]